MIPELRPYQKDLIDRVRQQRAKGARIIVVQAATGAGKTTVMAAISKAGLERNSRSLLLAHRRKLVEQISSRLEEFEINHGIIMDGVAPYGQASVQVASRDTIMSRVFRNEWTGLPPADIVMVDEAHHASEPDCDYRKILGQYPNATILLVSATPVNSEGRGLGPYAQAIECAAPTSQLIQDGYLVPVKCYAPDRKMLKGNKAKRGIAGDLVESWKEFGEDRPTVLFVSRVAHSLDAVAAYNAAGIPAVHIDADTPEDERDRHFSRLETGEVKIISNVGIVKEGVDIPCLGCCQFYMDVNGRVPFIQGVGRIMRAHPGKQYGILIDHAAAVFRHGFPDEDTEWTLEGNVNDDFKSKKTKGKTEPVNYCKECQLMFSTLACPQCGRMPSKPPRSIFAPPPIDSTNEILVEADRDGHEAVWSKDMKIKHWMRCLQVAAKRDSTFGMASQVYKQKYKEWPGEDFPMCPGVKHSKTRVLEMYPKLKRKSHA